MLSRQKRLLAGGAVIALAGAAALFLRHREQSAAPTAGAEPSSRGGPHDRWAGFEAGIDVPRASADAHPVAPDPSSRAVSPDQVDSAMTEWRDAILDKQADKVIALDQAFSMLPGRYGPALVKMAETDPDERVRAFCVRVLGKMKNPALVEDFQRMIADKSPFVRQNAAWALGELAKRPGGKEAALGALDELHQAAGDPVTEVRAAATNALKALQ